MLRDDQWTAIEALVVHRRGPWSCSAPGGASRRSTSSPPLLLRGQGAGPTVIVSPLLALMRNQVAAAERAGIRAVTINSTNIDDVGDDPPTRSAPARSTCCWSARSGSTTPTSATRCCPRSPPTLGLARRRRGALHLRLGPRLPARLPAHPHPARRARPTASRCWRRPRPPTSAWSTTSPSSWASAAGTRLVLRGVLDRESLRLGVVRLATAEQRLAWLAAPPRRAAGLGHRLHASPSRQAQEVAGYLRARGHDVAAYSGQTEAAERERSKRTSLADRVKALVATSALGMGFDKPDLGFVVHLGAPHRRSPTTSRSAVPAAAPTSADGVLLPAQRGPRHLARTSPRSRSRRRPWCADVLGALDPERPLVDAGAGDRGSTSAAPGSRRCSRCSTSTARSGGCKRRVDGHRRAVGLRRGALPPARRGPRARAAGDARLPGHRRLPDGASCAAQLDDPELGDGDRAAAATTAPASGTAGMSMHGRSTSPPNSCHDRGWR